MSDDPKVETPAALVTLFSTIREAINAAITKDDLPHRQGLIALQRLEFEIKPALEAIDLEAIVAAIVKAALEEDRRRRAIPLREALPLSSDLACRPGHRMQITSRPQYAAFRPVRFLIANAGDWIVHDIIIGNRSQLLQAGSIPASVLVDPDVALVFEALQTTMDLVIIVEYTGTEEGGQPFRGAVIGETEHTAMGRPRMPGTGTELRALLGAWQQIVSGTQAPQVGPVRQFYQADEGGDPRDNIEPQPPPDPEG